MFVESFFGLCILSLLILWANQKPKNMPPGEWGLPVIGYLPFMDRKITKTFEKLRKKYGKIFTVKIGAKVIIVLSDYNLIKSAFQKPEISGRSLPYNYAILRRTIGLGIVLSNGQEWATNRRFALKTLKDFGLGKAPILDEIILNEAQLLVKDLKRTINKPTEVDWNVNVAILNITFSLLASRHYDVNDKDIKEFTKDLNDNIEDIEGPVTIFAFLPWMISFVPNFVKDNLMHENRIQRKVIRTLDFLKNIIEEHKESLDENNPRDYIDKYLIECKQQKNNLEYSHCGDIDLLSNIYDFFMAGSETTSSTIRWFILYMMRFPDVQKRVQKEIDEFVPKGQLPSLYDKDKLPSLEALTYEINRVISLAPNAISHLVTEDTVLENYTIPKGSLVISNIESCHKNPQYWKNPNRFSIDNFLDDEGKVIRNKEGYLPFGLGRRQCPGESLAKMQLFIFMGAILQNFQILEPEGQNVPLRPIENINFLNLAPKFKVIFKIRN